MTEPLKFRIVKGNVEAINDTVVSALILVVMYYMLHPEKYTSHREAISGHWDRMMHRVSVWRARKAIQSLPEV